MALRAYSEKHLAGFVYGAIDGTLTTFAIVSGVIGANLSPAIVLVLGLANVLADGFSMASSNFLSERSVRELREEVSASSFERVTPLRSALTTFISFVIIGLIPLAPFGAALFFEMTLAFQFMLSIILTACAFITIGSIRGIVVKKGVLRSALETLLIGGLAAFISYLVGYLLRGLVPA